MRRTLGVVCAMAMASVIVVIGAVPVQAADITHSVHADFAVGNASYDNVVSNNNDLRVETIKNVAGDWYRGHYDGDDWQIDVNKDAAGNLWVPDTCLKISNNPWSNADRFTIEGSGYVYRTGQANNGVHELGLANGTISLPVSPMQASRIRFLTHGAKVDDAKYVITVEPASGATLVYTVVIPGADVVNLDRDGSGSGPGEGWTRDSIPNFTASADAGCLGNGGDEVVLTLPLGADIKSVNLSYPTEASPGLGGGWLGGPIALSVETTNEDYDNAFAWNGTYMSPNQTATGVRPPEGGGTPIWYEVDWVAAAMGGASEAELFVRCGTDANMDGFLIGGELRAQDGGLTGEDAWQGPVSMRGASPFPVNNCTGTHLQYRVDMLPEFSTTPRIDEITFTYNPDQDDDGYFAENVPGHGQQDCNDFNAGLNHDNVDGDGFSTCQGDCDDTAPTVFPGAQIQASDVADGVDRDCNGFDECYRDLDQDGQGEMVFVNGDGATVCDTNSGESDNADDCDDSRANVFLGNPQLVVGDGLDQDCSGSEECWQNLDGDPYGIEEIVDESPDGGVVCDPSDGEAAPQPVDAFDCDDANPFIHPGVVGERNNCRNPTAVSDQGSTSLGVPVTIDVLSNDIDPTNDPLIVQAGSVTTPSNGSAAIVAGGIEYTPDPTFIGVDTFTYRSTDGTHAAPDPAVVQVTVTAEPSTAPVVTVMFATPTVLVGEPVGFSIVVDNSENEVAALSLALETVAIPGAAVSYGDAKCAGSGHTIASGSFSTANRSVSAGGDCQIALQYVFDTIGDYTATVQGVTSSLGSSNPASDSVTVLAIPGTETCDGLLVTINMNTGASGMGTAGDDVILGTPGNDVIDAGAGNDTVCAGDGDDTVVGGDGDDKLIGEGGRDIMRGNPGVDVLLGGDGPDRLLGGIDGDTLDGGEGDDYLGGFGGNDTIIGGPGDEVIFGGFGGDTIDGGPGDDEIHGLIGDDLINGGTGNDALDGDRGNDTINGGDGNDVIRGGNAADTLNGDGGNDSVSGGRADDTLSGGAGNADVCVGNKHITADTADATCENIFGVP